MATYNNLINFTSQKPNYIFNFTYLGQKRSISVLQDFSNEGSIASVLWDCEWILCQYLLLDEQQTHRWNGKICVELGAGCALAASLLWHLGATVVATDLPEVVEQVTSLNVHNVFEETARITQLAKRKNQYAAAGLAWGNDAHAEAIDNLLLQKMGASKVMTVPKKQSSNKVSKKQNNKNSNNSAAASSKAVKQQQQESNTIDDDEKKKNDDDNADDLFFNVSASDRLTQSKIDYIFGADVIYHSEQHEILIRTLLTLMTESTIFVFVHRKRNEHDTNFIDALKRTFEITRITPVAEISKVFPKNTISCYEFVKKKV